MDKINHSRTKNVSKKNKISMGAEESAKNQLKDIWKSIKRWNEDVEQNER